MKTIRNLILSSASGLVALGGAQGGRPSGQSQGGRICKDLLALRRRLLLHPGHRHLHQDRRLSARGHYLQRWRLRRAELERRSRSAKPL